ncbi:MAG: zeta toxin family protein [Bdellovibrio sp.]
MSDEQTVEVAKAAQQQAMDACLQKIFNGETFCFETVFSHESKLELIKKAKANGYEVVLVFIHLERTELNIARVYQRVENHGHNVPYDKIKSRIPRAVENLKKAIPIVDKIALIDNSSTQEPLRTMVRIKDSKVIHTENHLPKWAEEILATIKI